MNTTTKAYLIEIVAQENRCTKQQAARFVDAFFEVVGEAIIAGNKIEARGFGSFIVKEMKARQGRNPKTGEPVFVSPRRKVGFKPGKILTAALSKPIQGVE